MNFIWEHAEHMISQKNESCFVLHLPTEANVKGQFFARK